VNRDTASVRAVANPRVAPHFRGLAPIFDDSAATVTAIEDSRAAAAVWKTDALGHRRRLQSPDLTGQVARFLREE
jgi:hydroxyacyl-ACP dehydratase HTD2-like protein with hotdog domain